LPGLVFVGLVRPVPRPYPVTAGLNSGHIHAERIVFGYQFVPRGRGRPSFLGIGVLYTISSAFTLALPESANEMTAWAKNVAVVGNFDCTEVVMWSASPNRTRLS
jgi:hypothetical protein